MYVVCFCSGKSQQLYESVLRAILQATYDLGARADPSTVVCDFEAAAMNAVGTVFGEHVSVQGCFYNLYQSTWRKVQELGLAQEMTGIHVQGRRQAVSWHAGCSG